MKDKVFGQWMKARRTERGMSLREIEVRTGIWNTALSYMELQGKSPTLSNFVRICEALGADPCEVLAELRAQ